MKACITCKFATTSSNLSVGCTLYDKRVKIADVCERYKKDKANE